MVDINAIHDINSIVGADAAVKPRPKPSIKVNDSPKPVVSVEASGVDRETVERISSDIREVLSSINVKLQLEVDNETGKIVIKIIDPETKEVIKQIPSKEMLRIGKRVAQLLSTYTNSKKPMVSIFKNTKVE